MATPKPRTPAAGTRPSAQLAVLLCHVQYTTRPVSYCVFVSRVYSGVLEYSYWGCTGGNAPVGAAPAPLTDGRTQASDPFTQLVPRLPPWRRSRSPGPAICAKRTRFRQSLYPARLSDDPIVCQVMRNDVKGVPSPCGQAAGLSTDKHAI